MLVFRSLVVGLLGAILMLLVTNVRAPQRVIVTTAALPAALPPGTTIVDVSRGRVPTVLDLQAVLGLVPGERLRAIDGAPATDDVLADRWREADAGRYLDVEVSGARGTRRVVVLVH